MKQNGEPTLAGSGITVECELVVTPETADTSLSVLTWLCDFFNKPRLLLWVLDEDVPKEEKISIIFISFTFILFLVLKKCKPLPRNHAKKLICCLILLWTRRYLEKLCLLLAGSAGSDASDVTDASGWLPLPSSSMSTSSLVAPSSGVDVFRCLVSSIMMRSASLVKCSSLLFTQWTTKFNSWVPSELLIAGSKGMSETT